MDHMRWPIIRRRLGPAQATDCGRRRDPLKERLMGLSTHALDTVHGCPAAGMEVKAFRLNQDGRDPEGLVLAGEALVRGSYRLVFDVADYFRSKGLVLERPAFLERVRLDFGVAQPQAHWHVPLLVSPWSYTTYRGS
jgi:5-hydroxyisourate hydrolase